MARASSPCRVAEPVILAPTGPNPAAVAEAAEHADRSMTNEANAPAASLPSNAAPAAAVRAVTNEASTPAEPPPITTNTGHRTPAKTDETNEATGPADIAARRLFALPAIVVALLALLFSAGLAAAFGTSADVNGPAIIGVETPSIEPSPPPRRLVNDLRSTTLDAGPLRR